MKLMNKVFAGLVATGVGLATPLLLLVTFVLGSQCEW